MLKLILFMFSPFIAIYVWFVFDAIGWVNVGIVFSLAIAFGLISIIRENKTKTLSAEEQRYNEYIESLNKEIQRPIIQARLAKLENKANEVENVIKGKATFTDKDGNSKDLDINIHIKM
ncbi:hypothetical protein ACLS0M_00235 [Avibacterium avium]|uniref:hypothetical protein n=1 Tax=Avibacterium avium TaxID=751 RepID=UPI003BF8BB60